MRDAISKYQKATVKEVGESLGREEFEDVRVSLSPEAIDEAYNADQTADGAAAVETDEFDIEESDFELPSKGKSAKVEKKPTAKSTPTKSPLHPGKGGASARPSSAQSTGVDILGNRDEIIREYAPLIKYIAQKIAARLPANIELDDLISAGVIGLMDAIDKYDPTRDNKFKTYAEFRVRGAILDELRAQDWVPRSVREKSKMIERAFAKIEQEKGRPATDEEVCEELKVSPEEFHELLNQVRSVSLLSYEDLSSFSRNDKRAALGLGENGKSPTPFSEVNGAALKKMIAEAIRDLPEKQRLVLSLYYYEDLNLKEIGKVLEVTESRVSQLHTQAVLRLRARLKNNFDEFLALFA